MTRRSHHLEAAYCWHKLSRPVSCRELVDAVLAMTGDPELTIARLAAVGRWSDSTVKNALWHAGVTYGRGVVRARLAPAPRDVRLRYKKLRANGIEMEEALRALGL